MERCCTCTKGSWFEKFNIGDYCGLIHLKVHTRGINKIDTIIVFPLRGLINEGLPVGSSRKDPKDR